MCANSIRVGNFSSGFESTRGYVWSKCGRRALGAPFWGAQAPIWCTTVARCVASVHQVATPVNITSRAQKGRQPVLAVSAFDRRAAPGQKVQEGHPHRDPVFDLVQDDR